MQTKVKKWLWGLFLVILWIGVFYVVVHLPDWWKQYRVNKIRELIAQNPMYPAAEGVDYDEHPLDQTTNVTWNDEEQTITLDYANGEERIATFCTEKDLKLLHAHVEEAEYGWINLHNGELLAVYTFKYFDDDNREWYCQFYQHIVNTGTIYVYREEILPE